MTQHPAIDGPVRGRPDVEGDVRRMLDVVIQGGIAIIPGNLGYGLLAVTPDANRRIIAAKQRGGHKRQGMVMDAITEREIHILDQRKRDIIECITADYNLPLGIIAKFREDHPLIRKLDPFLRKIGTARGAIGTALSDGHVIQEALARHSREHCIPFMGSSANVSGRGAKYRVEDIEPDIIAVADLVLDYGLCMYHADRNTSTQINFDTMEVTRVGACYDAISSIAKRHFNWELPPAGTASRNGHLHEFALVGVED